MHPAQVPLAPAHAIHALPVSTVRGRRRPFAEIAQAPKFDAKRMQRVRVFRFCLCRRAQNSPSFAAHTLTIVRTPFTVASRFRRRLFQCIQQSPACRLDLRPCRPGDPAPGPPQRGFPFCRNYFHRDTGIRGRTGNQQPDDIQITHRPQTISKQTQRFHQFRNGIVSELLLENAKQRPVTTQRHPQGMQRFIVALRPPLLHGQR